MDFRKLDVDELKELTEFFVVDVVAADENSPTKKELITALKTTEQPVTDEDYEVFQKAKATKQDKAPEVAQPAPVVENKPVVPIDTSNYVIIKFEGQNPRLDLAGHTFYKRHPYAAVDPETAEYIVRNHEGFRMALPSEIADYYG